MKIWHEACLTPQKSGNERGVFDRQKGCQKVCYDECCDICFLNFYHKHPLMRKKMHLKSEKKILQISHLICWMLRVSKICELSGHFHFPGLLLVASLYCGINQSTSMARVILTTSSGNEMIDNYSFRPLHMYLEYLDTDKMSGQVEKSI